MYTFYEFFAGGGMARLGLGDDWRCLYANDISPKKTAVYRMNFNDAAQVLQTQDIGKVKSLDLPGEADLAWGSFPCQDLSLAGSGAGLGGERSGVFWRWWRLLCELEREDRSPKIVVLENVQGALTSHNGADFVAIVDALFSAGYSVGALTVDAVHFVPQSRPRLFFIAIRNGLVVPHALLYEFDGPRNPLERTWHSDRLMAAHATLPGHIKDAWLWWRMAVPPLITTNIRNVLEPNDAVAWHSQEITNQLVDMMSEINRNKVRHMQLLGTPVVGTIYRRTRSGIQRAEARFDGISGCLRTPEGGSSRQIILDVNGPHIRSRLLAAREAARLMGLPDTYQLPSNYNDAYHIAGDGLAVPVVSWIEVHLLRPLLDNAADAQPPVTMPTTEFLLHA